MNRFFDIPSFALAELMPQTLLAQGGRDSDPLFILQDEMRFRSDIAGGVIVVPAGFTTDLASIPEELWTAFMEPDDPRISAAAVVHDLLCDKKGDIVLEDGRAVHLTSTQAAQILAFEGMADLGATQVQQDLVFVGVDKLGPHWL